MGASVGRRLECNFVSWCLSHCAERMGRGVDGTRQQCRSAEWCSSWGSDGTAVISGDRLLCFDWNYCAEECSDDFAGQWSAEVAFLIVRPSVIPS